MSVVYIYLHLLTLEGVGGITTTHQNKIEAASQQQIHLQWSESEYLDFLTNARVCTALRVVVLGIFNLRPSRCLNGSNLGWMFQIWFALPCPALPNY